MDELEREKNALRDAQFTVEEKFDVKDVAILELKKELQKAHDEIDLRKSVNDQMGQSLMKHETESMMMS